MSQKKKILTLDDLVAFCKSGKIRNFSSKESGYQLCVHTPSVLKYADEVEETESTLFAYVKMFHTGKNRNQSSVTKEAAENALDGIKYKPVLANFTDNTEDGELDFTAHDIEIKEDGTYEYLEKQVGCFTADDAVLRYDKDEKKDFVFAKMAIPKEYTPTADILKRKGGTKVSVELLVNEMSYNTKDKVLELNDIEVRGCTLLGTDPDTGKPVEEGMKGAKASLADFSVGNNSVLGEADTQSLIKTLGELNENLSNFFNSQMQKGGKSKMDKFNELLKKYNVTEEDVKFDYKGMSDEDLESAFKAAFDAEAEGTEGDDVTDPNGTELTGTEDGSDDGEETEPLVEGDDEETDPEPVNTEELDAAIASAGELEEEDYTASSWEKMQEALEAANTAKETPDVQQGAINTAKDNLNSAIEALVNIKDLKTLISSVDSLEEEKYTEESWKAVQGALTKANSAIESPDSDQDAINTAKQELDKAISELKEKEIVVDDDDESEERRRRITSENSLRTEIKFQLSHEDIRSGLYGLLTEYEQADNDYYFIVKVYDDYFVFESWVNGSFYGQKYKLENDQLSFDGDKYSLFMVFLTEEEVETLNSLRSENDELKAQLKEFQKEADDKEKANILSDTSYKKYLEEPEFKELVSNKDKYTVEEFNIQAEVAFAKCVKRFSFGETKTRKVLFTSNTEEKKNPYGNIFLKK